MRTTPAINHLIMQTKFGKYIQKSQLEIPEYAASFVDYKALKKLIKRLSIPVNPSQHQSHADPQGALQANKGVFFFRLERELDKVNLFYLQKEAELKLRLETLLERKLLLHQRNTTPTKLSTVYGTLEEGLRLFTNDLGKLQHFIETNQTAFSKILKKWDKSSKSRTKELYVSRAVEIQPCFNRDIVSDLSDKATTSLLELGAWAEGQNLEYAPSQSGTADIATGASDHETDLDSEAINIVNTSDLDQLSQFLKKMSPGPETKRRISRIFFNSINTAPITSQMALRDSSYVDFAYRDDINERSYLHELAISGRLESLNMVLESGADPCARDVYGRIPLHYACINGHDHVIQSLFATQAQRQSKASHPPTVDETINALDVDNFTPLVHAIVHAQLAPIKILLKHGARVDPLNDTDHIPLNLACQYGTIAVVTLLLQSSPKILPDAEGLFPQHLVPRSKRDPMILLRLKQYGADLDQPDKLYQWTPLIYAASEGHLPCLDTLLQCNVNVEALDEKGFSAAYYAAWEGHLDCLALLEKTQMIFDQGSRPSVGAIFGVAETPMSKAPTLNPGSIPDLALPPPIIPLRRYGHNFLDTTKTFIVITFDTTNSNSIRFYGEKKHPAARLAISSKSSDLIPRNIALPIQDEYRTISFQIENLETFSIDFDVFPTFGSKVIARGAASSTVFTSRKSSSGYWHLELFDPRLRAIGRVSFEYQVVTPFRDIPMEITQFATYWKATSQTSSKANALVTGSSLAGEYLRVYVQTTKDMVPVLYPQWAVPSDLARYGVHNDLIHRLTFAQLTAIAHDRQSQESNRSLDSLLGSVAAEGTSLKAVSRRLFSSCLPLKDVLARLPIEVHVEVHVVYPTRVQEDEGQLGPTSNMNATIDAVLAVVFEHAGSAKAAVPGGGPIRSIVFSSYNHMICTALNWKQPNYPVLLCNEFGADTTPSVQASNVVSDPMTISPSGRTSMSIKDAVCIAQSNNFMGLMCSSKLLNLVPSLIDSIKAAGLVLIMNVKHPHAGHGSRDKGKGASTDSSAGSIDPRVDGSVEDGAVLRFADTVDV